MIVLKETVERQIGGKPTAKKKTKPKKVLSPSAPSIPSKFDERKDITIFENLNTGTAFLRTTKRFDVKKNVNPGPGQYHMASSYIKDAGKCGSVSARGYTAMISLDPRFSDLKELQSRHTPCPATYMPSLTAMKPSSAKTNFGLHSTTENKRQTEHVTTPGPGHYFFGSRSKLPSNLGAASFKFTERKESDVLLQQDTPVAVGSYEVAKSLDYIEKLGKEPRKGKDFPDHIFSSTASRLAPSVVSEAPAPGYYDCEPYLSHEMFRQNSVFNSGLDRFGHSNNVRAYRENTPGPDTYCCNDISTTHNTCGAVASFASTSERFEEQHKNELQPGPQSYTPHHIPRKSFHMNRHCQWL